MTDKKAAAAAANDESAICRAFNMFEKYEYFCPPKKKRFFKHLFSQVHTMTMHTKL
jgi:hypothetical protein